MKRLLIALAAFLGLCGAPAKATISCSLPFTLTNGTLADATQVMANFNALVTCFTLSASAGSNSDITALNGLITPITPGQGGTNLFIGGTSTGSANAQVISTTSPNTFVLTAGLSVAWLPLATNTGALQINVRSLGLKNVFRPDTNGSVITTSGEVCAGVYAFATYDGTQFQLLNPCNATGGAGKSVAVAISANVADLGLNAPNHLATIGAGTITGFGSTADVNLPLYYVTFTGVTTLTYNATSLILPGTANIVTAQNDSATLQYLGGGNWQMLDYARANGTAVVNPTPLCGAVNFTAKNNAGTPNTNFDYSADSAVMINPTGNVPIFFTSISGTLNTTTGTVTPTADGMDGEARPTSAWGYFWLISNGVLANSLMSTTLSPTMPAGYTYRCRLAAFSFDASQNAFRMAAVGNINTYTLVAATNTANTVIITNGTQGTFSITSPTLSAIQVTGNTKCAPVTASDVQVSTSASWKALSAGQIEVAPSTAWGGTNNGPSGTAGNVWPLVNDSSQPNLSSSVWGLSAWIHLESNSIGYASSGVNTALGCLGYKDRVNAN